jgi:hypothetical protein
MDGGVNVRMLLASLGLLLGCGDDVMLTPSHRYVRVSDYPTAQAALDAVSVWGGVLDMEGVPRTVSLELRASPMLVGQVRFVTITNCGGGLTPESGKPVLRVASGVHAYFTTLSECLVLGPVVMDRMHNATVRNVWMPTGGLSLTGAAYYNRIENLYAGGNCLTATATGGPSTGPNHNQLIGGRCQGTVTIGSQVQDWIIEGVAFEGCAGTCLSLAGTRLWIGNNRFECAAPVGIDLLIGSDGWIGEQYWSSCGVRIRFNGADAGAWSIAPQPNQQ